MTFVLSGCNGFRNRGVEALVVPSVTQLRLRRPGEEVVVLTAAPDYDDARGTADATLVKDPYIGRVGSLGVRRVGARWAGRLFRLEAEARRHIAGASVVIASGGDNFSSDYGDIRMHLEPLRVAQQCGTPTVMLAQSIGPFRKEQQRKHFLEVARRVDLITVRESRSYVYVTARQSIEAEVDRCGRGCSATRSKVKHHRPRICTTHRVQSPSVDNFESGPFVALGDV